VRSIVAAWCCAALITAAGGCRDAATSVVVAQPLEATFASIDGATLQLSELRGQLLVVNFWATWCAPCRNEMPGLQRLAGAVAGERLTVMAVSIDADVNLVREFVLRYGLTIADFLDAQPHGAARAWNIDMLPQTLVIGRDGRLLERIVGARDWDDVPLRTHLVALANR